MLCLSIHSIHVNEITTTINCHCCAFKNLKHATDGFKCDSKRVSIFWNIAVYDMQWWTIARHELQYIPIKTKKQNTLAIKNA